jgi:hypothetical protein
LQSIFIICSTEGLKVARAVEANLRRPDLKIDVWDKAEKSQNEWLLGSLLNSASFYDFGLAILTPDDVQLARKSSPLLLRGRRQRAPRDNVVFEAGLFLGRLGVRRSFVLLHKQAKLPTDLSGTIITRFDAGNLDDEDELRANTRDACEKLNIELSKPADMALFSLLPSTGLAIGYYHNFVSPVLDAFESGEDYKIETSQGETVATEELGSELATDTRGLPNLFIWLPARLDLLSNDNIRVFAGVRRRISIRTPRRSFAFYVDIVPGSPIRLVDVPTTLLASWHAMQGIPEKAPGIFSDDFLNVSRRTVVERREIENFRWTVETLAKSRVDWPSHLHFEYFDIMSGSVITRGEL